MHHRVRVLDCKCVPKAQITVYLFSVNSIISCVFLYNKNEGFFAHSVFIKLASTQTALLRLRFSLEMTVVLHLDEGPD